MKEIVGMGAAWPHFRNIPEAHYHPNIKSGGRDKNYI